LTAEQLIQSLKICEENLTCEDCILIDYYTEDKSCRDNLIMLICIAVLNTLKNTDVKEDHLEAVEDIKRVVEERGFYFPDDKK